MICTQSVMYSLVSTEQTKSTVTVSTLVFIDILYAQYLVGFTQLFDLQEKHGTRKQYILLHKFSYSRSLSQRICIKRPASKCTKLASTRLKKLHFLVLDENIDVKCIIHSAGKIGAKFSSTCNKLHQ